MKQRSLLGLVAITTAIVASACVDAPMPLGTDEASITTPIVVQAAMDDGFGSDGRRVRLVGTFPAANGACTYPWFWEQPHASCYEVLAYCHGAMLVGRITSKSTTEIAFRIPERPSTIDSTGNGGSSCTFRVSVSDTNGLSGPVASPALVLPSPPIQITGVQDVPRPPSSTWHYFGLYGYFPLGGNFTSTVVCDGVTRTSSVTTPNNPSTVKDQVNIRFAETDTTSKSCTFSIRRLNDNAVTPIWHQRVNGAAPGLPTLLGTYHWGGFQPDYLGSTQALPIAIRKLREAGVAGAIRLSLTPRQRNAPANTEDYYDDWRHGEMRDSRCAGLTTSAFLPWQICTTRMQAALTEVGAGATVILTTMDQASAGADGQRADYADPAWMTGPGTTNFDAVKQEYYELARNLILTQGGAFKTFIISNWEGDNLLYCLHPGDVVAFYHDDPGASLSPWCGTGDGTASFYAARRDALINWFKARKAGIDQARAEASPWDWVYVYDGIEFAAYRFIHNGAPALANIDVLHGIIPAVLPTYALYSSWETTDRGGVDQDFTELTAYLYQLRPADPIKLVIGEFGRRGQAIAPAGLDGWILKEQVRAARRAVLRTAGSGFAQLQHLILWQAFPTIDEQQGLLSVDGAETAAMRATRVGITGAPGTGATDVVINAVREVSPDFAHPLCPPALIPNRIGTNRVFELYGVFPGGPYQAGWRCSWRASAGDVLDETFATVSTVGNSGQRNISIPGQVGADMWCIFYVENTTTHARSAEFGPVLSRAKGPCNAPT